MPFTLEPSVVFETVFLLCYYSRSCISSSQILGVKPFSEKSIQASLCMTCIINSLHDASKPLAKDILRLCLDLPTQQKASYLEGIQNVLSYSLLIGFSRFLSA